MTLNISHLTNILRQIKEAALFVISRSKQARLDKTKQRKKK